MIRLITERPGYRVYREDGEVCIEAAPSTLDAIEQAHASIDSPHVPDAHRDGARLVLSCDAVASVGAVLTELAKTGHEIGYGEAVAFNEFLMDVVEAGHRAGWYLGSLAWPSVLTTADGELSLLGFGLDATTRPNATTPGASVAPEVTLGLEPTAASDVFVLHTLVRTLLPFATLPAGYRAALSGSGEVEALRHKLVEMSQQALAPDPAMRPQSIEALRQQYRAVRPLVPGMPVADFDAMRATLREGVRALEPRTVLHLDMRTRSMTLGSVTLDLSRRALLWRLMTRLIEAHETHTPLSADALIEAGWPDESIQVQAARTRLYTAVRDLRKRGLGDHLQSRDGGYFLAPEIEVRKR